MEKKVVNCFVKKRKKSDKEVTITKARQIILTCIKHQ